MPLTVWVGLAQALSIGGRLKASGSSLADVIAYNSALDDCKIWEVSLLYLKILALTGINTSRQLGNKQA